MAGESASYAETGRCHTQARRWPLMIGNQGWRVLNMVGAPWPLPQLVALAALFAVCWKLRPLLADGLGGPVSLLVCVVVPVAGSLPLRRTRIAGRVPWRWLLGQVALLTGPATGRPTGPRARFSGSSRVGGQYWLIPAGTVPATVQIQVPAATTVPATVSVLPVAAVRPRVALAPRPPAAAPEILHGPGPAGLPVPLSSVEAMRALLSA